jgi:hypothetical protein
VNSSALIIAVFLACAVEAGATWPGADAALLVLVPAVALFALALVAVLHRAAAGAVSTSSIPAWPILPAAVAVILPVTLWRAARR